MTRHLNHELLAAPVPNFQKDVICINCGVRLEPTGNGMDYNLITGYIPNLQAGEIVCIYNLTCEEQQIKNLLE